jgi:hypothetical protein
VVHSLEDNDWAFDPSSSEAICLPEGAKPVLHRYKMTNSVNVRLTGHAHSTLLAFDPGVKMLRWTPPQTSPGTAFRVAYGDAVPRLIRIIALDLSYPNRGLSLV